MKEVQPKSTWVRVSASSKLSGVNRIYLTRNNHRLGGAGQFHVSEWRTERSYSSAYSALRKFQLWSD